MSYLQNPGLFNYLIIAYSFAPLCAGDGPVTGNKSSTGLRPPHSILQHYLLKSKEMEMLDKELLETAAKAAGMNGRYVDWMGDVGMADGDDPDGGLWNPLTNDAHAFRLAILLGIEYYEGHGSGPEAYAGYYSDRQERQQFKVEPFCDDRYAAARRAIVRAAAAIQLDKK